MSRFTDENDGNAEGEVIVVKGLGTLTAPQLSSRKLQGARRRRREEMADE